VLNTVIFVVYREYVEAKVTFKDFQNCATVSGIKCKPLAKEGARGSVVVKALSYKSEGRGIASR
jgi:hypothetical protein